MKQVAFLTDIHLDEQFPVDNNVNAKGNWQRVLADLASKNITEIIFGGDIGEPTAHEWFFESLKPFSYKLILGNHDRFDNVSRYDACAVVHDGLYYSFEYANYKFIFADSSADELSSTQLDWLKDELITNKELVLFIHHPVLAIDTAADKLFPLKNREELKAMIISNKAPVTIFCGHYHMNDERVTHNIRQFITPALSFQLDRNVNELEVNSSTFGYRIIYFKDDGIETEVITFIS